MSQENNLLPIRRFICMDECVRTPSHITNEEAAASCASILMQLWFFNVSYAKSTYKQPARVRACRSKLMNRY